MGDHFGLIYILRESLRRKKKERDFGVWGDNSDGPYSYLNSYL